MTLTVPAVQFAGQTATPPGVGPEELVDYWPLVVRLGWLLAGFLVVVIVGYVVVEPTVSRVVRRRNQNNQTVQEAITRYVRLAVLLVGFLLGAGLAGYGRVLADSAIIVAAGTVIIGVAAQTVIGSLVSGLVLVLDPEFNIGDYIEWEENEGVIRSIRLRVTRVQTPNGELVTVPNTTLTGQAITRPYGRGRYRVTDRFDVSYDADLAAVVDNLVAVAAAIDDIAAEPSPNVYVEGFEDSTVRLQVHYWVEQPRPGDVFAVRSAYAKASKERLDAAGTPISPTGEYPLGGRIEVEEVP